MQETLMSLKEVAAIVDQPPHRIIHLCEKGLIRPAADAVGRGKSRSFNRDNIFRIDVALVLQDAGIQIPQIRPLMKAFDSLLKSPIGQIKPGPCDLVDVVRILGPANPFLPAPPLAAWLNLPNGLVYFISPHFERRRRRPMLERDFAIVAYFRDIEGPDFPLRDCQFRTAAVINLTAALRRF